jgi:transposase DDE domain
MKNIKIEFTNERIIPAIGLAVVGAILGKSDFVKHCNRMDVTPNRSQHQIKNGDILLTYIGMLYMGKPDFQAVHEMDDDRDFIKLRSELPTTFHQKKPFVKGWMSLALPSGNIS